MSKYLLTITEGLGDRYQTLNNVMVEATDPGYAKYHWHKMMNKMGAVKEDEHSYMQHDIGMWVELEHVRKLEDEEVEILDGILTEIPGFNP